VVRRDSVSQVALGLLQVWAAPLKDFLRQVAQVARTGNSIDRIGNLSARAEWAAVAEAFLLMFPSGDKRRSTRHSALLGTGKGVVCLLNHDLVLTKEVSQVLPNQGIRGRTNVQRKEFGFGE